MTSAEAVALIDRLDRKALVPAEDKMVSCSGGVDGVPT
jgi:hypothetical protein